MTEAELHDAIVANPAAKALADAGNDSGCAALIAATLPPVVIRRMIDYSTILGAFANPTDGMTAIGGLKAAGQGNVAIALMLGWLEPTCFTGLDVGSPAVRGMLDSLVPAQALTAAAAATIKSLAEIPATVTASEVSAAWLQYRPEGRIA